MGFRHLLALVHDVFEDRRPLYQQLAARIEEDRPRTAPRQSPAELQVALSGGAEKLDSFSALLTTPYAGTTLGQAYTLHSGLEVPSIGPQKALAALSLEQAEALAPCMQTLAPFVDLWREDSCWIEPKGSQARADFSALSNEEARQFFADLKALLQARLAFESACTNTSVSPTPETLEAILASRAGACSG